MTSAHRLATRVVTATRTPAVGHLTSAAPGLLYTGTPATTLHMDGLGVSTATNSAREVFARVPGANLSETRGDGFPSDGIGFRGLNPTQSVEVNTRQNGVMLSADPYGYPETYYTPPLEAVDRIEVIRGAAGLQYGAQIGGMVNYVMRDGTPGDAPAATIHQSGGSFGLYDAFGSVGGGSGRWTYYGFGHYERNGGWRPNADFWDGAGYASLTYQASDRLRTSVQLTSSRNDIHMPGGLTDREFAADPATSYRARNWLASPWNILASTTTYRISSAATMTTTLSGMVSQRYLVWRNEDGGPQASDSIDPSTGRYAPREVQRERFGNGTIESRLGVNHAVWGRRATLAAGVRLFDGAMRRQGGAPGTTGAGFDMTRTGPFGYDLSFATRNAAAYVEEGIQVTDRLVVTPGVRGEWLQSGVQGYNRDTAQFTVPHDTRSRAFALGGLGIEYAATPAITAYGNVAQSYRPVTYDNLTPFASTSRVDPHMRDATGYSADLGVRGAAGAVTGDVDVFYLWYGHRVGVVALASGATEVTNVADSRHVGLESSLELDVLRAFGLSSASAHLSVSDNLAVISARYLDGPYAGRNVEFAPPIIHRLAMHASIGAVRSTLAWSHTARSFADATNVVSDLLNPGVGIIPAYHVIDWQVRLALGSRWALEGGIDNLTNARYFTLRTTEYPGPGIIPAIGRTVSLSLQAMLP